MNTVSLHSSRSFFHASSAHRLANRQVPNKAHTILDILVDEVSEECRSKSVLDSAAAKGLQEDIAYWEEVVILGVDRGRIKAGVSEYDDLELGWEGREEVEG